MNKRYQIKELLNKGEIYGMTAAQYSPKGNIETVSLLLQTGVKIIQYREKNDSKRNMLAELQAIKIITDKNRAILIVNDHLDLCQLIGADGVHLGQEDIPVEEARGLLGEGAIIGLSTHNPQQGREAQLTSADYIGVGPVFETATKPEEPVAGLEYAGYAARFLTIPKVALGGISEKNVSLVEETGIRSICMVKDLLEARDMADKIRKIRSLIRSN
ncbi:MAG: thiamine phosphate synthase [Proteobacteria bacterium]|nr:thiamine phosphate synthase [Pseudomonadota bacterium]